MMWSRQESNLDPGLRRPLYYPLYYRTNMHLFRCFYAAVPGRDRGALMGPRGLGTLCGQAGDWECEIKNYFNNTFRFVLNILTAIASRMTPKNFRVAIIPAGPNIFSIKSMDFRTRKIKIRLRMMPSRTVVVS